MNERDKEIAKQAGFYLYDLMETHEIKTIETDSRDEWVTLQKLIDLIRADERARLEQAIAELAPVVNNPILQNKPAAFWIESFTQIIRGNA
jgi:N-acetylglucosamine kinase-like BadF-type ATPase